MPAKIDRCVKHVMAQGKSKDNAYGICVKSTGIMKTGKHTWGKKTPATVPVSEAATIKIGHLIQEADDRFQNGLYVEAKFDPGALEKIWKLLKKIGFKNMLPVQRAHATIIYSKRQPNKRFVPTSINGIAEPDHFEIFGGRGKPHLLVLVVKSKELQRKHNYYMKEYQLKHDYGKNYTPHITIVYDIQRLLPGLKLNNPKAKASVENMFNLLIKDMPKQIRILKEESSELSKNWQ